MNDTVEIIRNLIKEDKNPDIEKYRDLFFLCEDGIIRDIDVSYYIETLKWLSDLITFNIQKRHGVVSDQYYLHYDVLKLLAPLDFESYMYFMEWNRDVEKQFYKPREKALRPIVKSLQELEDGGLDLLAISLPPGVGKSTLALFYLTWISGRHPELPSLVGSHSNAFIRGCYDECLRILSPNSEYQWGKVFPNLSITSTNAKDCRIDIGNRKRFETLEMTSIGSGNAGLYRAQNCLFCDDLVSGIEIALSKERLDKLWETYVTDLRQRKQGSPRGICRELHIATRWSVHDILGRLEQEYAGSDRARFITVPALNEKGESNFDYPFGVGFTTEMYEEQKAIMDDASWRALYMNEPIEREGLVFPENELRRYFELPKGDDGKVLEPDAIISVCDTKDKGDDYCVMPIAYVYGKDYYIEDVICDNGLPNVVDARLINALLKHKVAMSRFESNSAGRRVAEEIQRGVKAHGGNTHITTKYTTANKVTKIITESKWVLEHCLFKDKSRYTRGEDYGQFINFLTTYTQAGKNKHDDVPDAMAMLAQFARSFTDYEVKIIDRPF